MLSFPLCFRQFAGVPALLLGSFHDINLTPIQLFESQCRRAGRPVQQLGPKLGRPNNECPGRSGCVDNFMIRGHHRAVLAIESRKTLNHLIGSFTSFGIHNFDTGLELPVLRAEPPLPAVEDHSDGVTFSLSVPGQAFEECLASLFETSGTGRDGHSGTAHKVIPIDKKMCCHYNYVV